MRTIVIGCGRVGSRLVHDLAARHADVDVVDVDPAAADRLGTGFTGRFVAGSGLDRRVLDDVDAGRADALAAVTGDDAVNAVVARAARTELGVPTVVARIYDPSTAAVYDRLGIRAVSPVSWGARRIGELLAGVDLATVTSVGVGGVDLVDARVPALLDGRPAGELEVPGEIRVVALTRGGRTTFADRATTLAAGDLVHLVVHAASSDRLDALLGRSHR